MSLCLVRLIEPVFRSIEHRVSSFFKNNVLTDSNTFSKLFSNFSLSLTWQGSTEDFLSFSLQFLQGFSLTRPVRPLYPSFCFYFHDFMHKLMQFLGNFWNFSNLGFLLNQSPFYEIDHWVLLVYCYIHDLCWLI